MGNKFMENNKRKISILIPIKKTRAGLMLFMQRRSADMKVLPNHFGFWGGGAEGDENPEEALVREIKEELGININLDEVEFFNRYEFLKSIKHIYLYEPPEDWESRQVIGEGDYGKWFFSKEALAKADIILEDKVVINDLERAILKSNIK